MDKLMNMNDKAILDVKIVLLTGAKNHLGIANLPNEADLNQICAFLQSKYGDFTAKEIDDALQRYASGSLSVSSKAYGVLSTMFLSDLLNEYRVLRKMWNDFAKRQENQLLQLQEAKKDENEVNENLCNWLCEYVQESGVIPDAYDWDAVYKHLEKVGEINLSREDKVDFYNIEKEGIMESVNYYKDIISKKSEMMELLRILQDEKMMQSYCRRKLVHLYLNQIIRKQNGTSSRNQNEKEVQ